jgi:putative phosphoesterase
VRIAVISDTHMPRGERRLPDRCLEECRTADAIIHAGDFSGVSVLDQIEALGPPVAAVYGNVEEPGIRERLPEERLLEAAGATIAIVHNAGPAAGRLSRMQRRFPEADAVVFGHSHMPLHETDPASGFQIFNPGSPTERRRAPRRSMGLASAEGGKVAFEHLWL